MNLSRELQIGKAAEHLVCYDLIMQGYAPLLADQGLPFDIVVMGHSDQVARVQVKSTTKLVVTTHNPNPHYVFHLRRARGNSRIVTADDVDVVAFVALDTATIGYVRISSLISEAHGGIVSGIDFYPTDHPVKSIRIGAQRRRTLEGRVLNDYEVFPWRPHGNI